MPAKDRPPSFQFYPRDWIIDTRHMSRDQRCRYHDALCESWLAESYGIAPETRWREWLGYLPDEWPSVRSVYASRFLIRARIWTQRHMSAARESQVRRYKS